MRLVEFILPDKSDDMSYISFGIFFSDTKCLENAK